MAANNARYFATTRSFTGARQVRAYVYDRKAGRPIIACPHKHRNEHTAHECSLRLLAAWKAIQDCEIRLTP